MKHHSYPDHIVEHVAKALWNNVIPLWDEHTYVQPRWEHATASQRRELYQQAHCTLEALQEARYIETVDDAALLPEGSLIHTATGIILVKLSPVFHDWKEHGTDDRYTGLELEHFPLVVLSFGAPRNIS